MADDVLAVLDALGIERVKLVGHDWGGWIGFLLALRAPERFDRYLALNILPPWTSDAGDGAPPLALLVPVADPQPRASATGCTAAASSSRKCWSAPRCGARSGTTPPCTPSPTPSPSRPGRGRRCRCTGSSTCARRRRSPAAATPTRTSRSRPGSSSAPATSPAAHAARRLRAPRRRDAAGAGRRLRPLHRRRDAGAVAERAREFFA